MSGASGNSDANAEIERELTKRLGGPGLAVRAMPMFDLWKGTSTTFVCTPSRVAADDDSFGHWLLDALDDEAVASLDLKLVDVAARYARRFSDARLSAEVVCTVAYSTLANPGSREAYAKKLMAAKLANGSPLLVKVELIPTGTPAARLSDVVSLLKNEARVLFLSIDHVEDWATWNHGAVGAVALGLMLKSDDDVAAARRKAEWLRSLCAPQGSLSFLEGVASPETAKTVAEQAIRFATGPAYNLTLYSMDGGLPNVPLAAR